MSRKLFYPLFLISLIDAPLTMPPHAAANDTTYYVSTSDGDDGDDGLSESNPFQSIAKVNALDLQPGDQVLFKCGDTWRAEMLIIIKSGTEGNPSSLALIPLAVKTSPSYLARVRSPVGASTRAIFTWPTCRRARMPGNLSTASTSFSEAASGCGWGGGRIGTLLTAVTRSLTGSQAQTRSPTMNCPLKIGRAQWPTSKRCAGTSSTAR